jgi:hypothetical protein
MQFCCGSSEAAKPCDRLEVAKRVEGRQLVAWRMIRAVSHDVTFYPSSGDFTSIEFDQLTNRMSDLGCQKVTFPVTNH